MYKTLISNTKYYISIISSKSDLISDLQCLFICLNCLFFRNRAWLKWKYRLQHPWLDLASLPEFPPRPWPAQDLWVCSPLSMVQARLPHPPVLLLQADLGMPLYLPHHQVDPKASLLGNVRKLFFWSILFCFYASEYSSVIIWCFSNLANRVQDAEWYF